ncbi:hypothetical protein [Micromonospora sp. NPDC048839]|uniref:hypothetical protein n=1 Tax=Micromonospora sp. NPDC048839 TaxID=3155641 RepID=UPI0033CF0165
MLRTGLVTTVTALTLGASACAAPGPPTLRLAGCAPEAEGQLFRFVETDQRDSEGRRTYRIESASGPVTFDSRDGLHVQDPADDARVTGFAVLDRGPA